MSEQKHNHPKQPGNLPNKRISYFKITIKLPKVVKKLTYSRSVNYYKKRNLKKNIIALGASIVGFPNAQSNKISPWSEVREIREKKHMKMAYFLSIFILIYFTCSLSILVLRTLHKN